MSICAVDRNTYSIILRREYERQLSLLHFEDIAMARARENVSRAFVCDETLDALAFEKDHDDAKQDKEWTI